MKSKLLSLRFLLAATLALPLLTACETEEDRTLAEAENCINRATAATVDACVNKVAGMTSEDAYLIRCSAHFIAQGFDETRLSQAFAQIKSKNPISGVTPTTIAFSYMVFDQTKANHTVAISKNDCELSGAASLSRVLSLVEVATTFAGAAGVANGSFTPGDTANLESYISGFVGNGGDPATLGNMALGIREDFCVNNSPFSGTDICTKMNLAYTNGGGDPTTIGQQIINLLQ